MKQAWNSFLRKLSRKLGQKNRQRTFAAGLAAAALCVFAAIEGSAAGAMVVFAETTGQAVLEGTATSEGAGTAGEERRSEMRDAGTKDEKNAKDTKDTKDETKENAENEQVQKQAEAIKKGPGYREPGYTEEKEPAMKKEKEESRENSEGESDGKSSENTGTEESEDKEAAAVKKTTLSEKDYNTLLRIVQAEAGGCDLKGRILVANVILNRVESRQFPGTVTGVVYQKSQFSPVANGSINTCKVTDKTREAVDRALAGEDYSQGALYFMNRKASSKKNVRWFDRNLTYLFYHDGHEFFR